jgi:hypothetical protein
MSAIGVFQPVKPLHYIHATPFLPTAEFLYVNYAPKMFVSLHQASMHATSAMTQLSKTKHVKIASKHTNMPLRP